ncbi:MAG: phosphatidylserine decarboxylase family protein [Microscillaceae bacterium]|nr:phosphatidylserine decarboxylase family protein [Microscillaceae bacterium]MDW8459679.1 phosphatidylserine decarboxylase family protein [Cytophagales bacterium]
MFKIHREGFQPLSLVATILAISLLSADYWISNQILNVVIFIVGGGVMLFLLYFFRNPSRNIVPNPHHIVAPADGKVVALEETEETEFLKSKVRQISIFMSPFDVHLNRNPVSGKVVYYKYHAGKYWVAWHPKSSTENERTTIGLQTQNGTLLVVRQIAGVFARRIKCYLQVGQPIVQGEELGFIKFGSRVDVFLPLNAEVKVGLNQKTKAGETIIATLSN